MLVIAAVTDRLLFSVDMRTYWLAYETVLATVPNICLV